MLDLPLLSLLVALGLQTPAPARADERPGVDAPAQRAAALPPGPAILRASAATAVRANTERKPGRVTFPIPGVQRGQVPLGFDLVVTPPEALKGFRWREREDGTNLLCEVDLVPGPGNTHVRWEALLFVPEPAPAALPYAEEPEAPAATKAWLASTACIQSADPDIERKASELGADAHGVQAYVERVLAFTSTNRGERGAAFTTLDAKQALRCGGSCTSRANLAAALLRARGIPARTVAHLPTWVDRLYEHWLVEYWHPGAGWVWIESSRGELQPARSTVAVLNVAEPADEERSFDASMAHSGVALGAPDLSVHKHSPELLLGEREADPAGAGNWARSVLRLEPGSSELAAFERAAQAAYPALLAAGKAGRLERERTARLTAALGLGRVAALTEELSR